MKLIISENEKKRILYLYGLSEQGVGLQYYEEPEPSVNSPTEEKENEYPNYCLYPNYTVKPSSTEVQGGASGEDLYIDGYCLYAQPAEYSIDYGTNGIWLPNTGDTRIIFWDQSKRNKIYKTYESYLKSVGVSLDYNSIKEQVDNLYKDGLVNQFKINGVHYLPAISSSPDNFRIVFAGYYVSKLPQSEETKYKSPKWIDRRDDFAKFIDKYETKLVMAALAIGVAISAVYTGPFAILIELAIELGVGIPLAIRDFQKGKNTSGIINLLGSLLPLLRLSKTFKGYDEKTLDSLILKLQKKEKKLINASSDLRAKNFYNGLTKEEKILLTKLLDEDEYGLWATLKNLENPEKFEQIVVTQLKSHLASNKQVLGKQSFWKTILGKELKFQGKFMLFSYLYETLFDYVLDDETKKKLNELEVLIPDSYKPDFYSQMMIQKSETIENMKKNGNIDKCIKYIQNSKKTQETFNNFFNNLLPYAIKDSTSSEGVKKTDYGYSDESDIEELKKDGWVDFEEWDEIGQVDTSMTLGNRVFLKIKKTPLSGEKSIDDKIIEKK